MIFEGLDGVVIRDSCLKTDEAAGLCGIDAAGWRRILPLSRMTCVTLLLPLLDRLHLAM